MADAMNRVIPVQDLVGFIDGTARATCRPDEDQDLFYNGYYHCHGIKFQSVMSLLGLVIDWAGPVSINDADSLLLAKSGLLDRMAALENLTGRTMKLYGDPAYAMGRHLCRSFKGAMTQEQIAFCNLMNPHRQSVENGFAVILSN